MRAFTPLLLPLLLGAVSSVTATTQTHDHHSTVHHHDMTAPHHESSTHAPHPDEVQAGEKRTPPAGVYVCDETNWHGTCAWIAITDSQCMNFPWYAGTSFGVPNGWQCKFYYEAKCAGANPTNGQLTFPGTPNLGAFYNNELKPMSYKCRECPGDPECVNNKAPSWDEAIVKYGGKGSNGKCSVFSAGNTYTTPCPKS